MSFAPPREAARESTTSFRSFASADARDSFYSSKLFHDWEETIAALVEGVPLRQELSGLEAWFSLRSAAAAAQPPKWKMALVTLIGVYPVSIFRVLAAEPGDQGTPPVAAGILHCSWYRSDVDVGGDAGAGTDSQALAVPTRGK